MGNKESVERVVGNGRVRWIARIRTDRAVNVERSLPFLSR
jgi:hypothetical protein